MAKAMHAYTTTVPPARSVADIQKLLAENGAHSIRVDYQNGRPTAVMFAITVSDGRGGSYDAAYRLPANIPLVHRALKRRRVQPRYQTLEQAERVTWRVILTWLQAQLAAIESGMASIDEVMLPYALASDGRTLHEHFRQHGPAMLNAPREESP